jgi:hypothetical protein
LYPFQPPVHESARAKVRITALKPRLNALMSFGYTAGQRLKLIELKARGIIKKLFLDSHTFVCNPGGQNPGFDRFWNYLPVLKAAGVHCDLVATYDVDFKNPRKNENYHLSLLKHIEGITCPDGAPLQDRVVPVLHDRLHPEDEFMTYLGYGAKYIGLGSRPKLSDEHEWGLNKLRREYGVPLHQFGNLSEQTKLHKLMPDSADSISFASTTMFDSPTVLYWNPTANKREKIKLIRGDELTPEQETFFGETFSLTRQELFDSVVNRWIVNIFAICQLQEHLTREWYPAHAFDGQGKVVSVQDLGGQVLS